MSFILQAVKIQIKMVRVPRKLFVINEFLNFLFQQKIIISLDII